MCGAATRVSVVPKDLAWQRASCTPGALTCVPDDRDWQRVSPHPFQVAGTATIRRPFPCRWRFGRVSVRRRDLRRNRLAWASQQSKWATRWNRTKGGRPTWTARYSSQPTPHAQAGRLLRGLPVSIVASHQKRSSHVRLYPEAVQSPRTVLPNGPEVGDLGHHLSAHRQA